MKHKRKKSVRAFSLAELLISATFLLILIGFVAHLTGQTSEIWRNSNARMRAFQEARAGFEVMTRKLSQATLNTYQEYYNSANLPRSSMTTTNMLASFVPTKYDRYSDLHFITGHTTTLLAASPAAVVSQTHCVFFQAPLGYSVTYRQMNNALNACGYFLQFDSADSSVPDHVKLTPGYRPRYRFRLMEMMQTTEKLGVYYDPSKSPVPGVNDWFVKNAVSNSRIIGENVIALVVLPSLSDREDDPTRTGKGVSIAPAFNYNSRIALGAATDSAWGSASPAFPGDSFTYYPADGGTGTSSRHAQLPPLVKVVMVVIDEASAMRLQGSLTTIPTAIDFRAKALFKDASKLKEDIQAVEDICNAKPGNLTGNTQRLTYRVFSSDLIMRAAKWSNK
ncbi:MAG: hypothetical protein ACAI35_13525 [Candidatus Methylacidiphilales bacterium]|nr:hypothetical protein [Candidatus Methylacidiphilales bacterium]